jgi:deaminated glutathione amidase
MKIAAIQMVSTTDVAQNLEAARRLINEAASRGAQLIGLPEYFCLMGRRDGDKLAIAEPPGTAESPCAGPIQQMLSSAAREHGVWLMGGTLPIQGSDPSRVWNANCVYAPDGRLAARYDKIHLFRFDNGREHYDEGVAIQPGTAPVAMQAGGLKVGLSVCYDLRFPELYRALMGAVVPEPAAGAGGSIGATEQAGLAANGPCDVIAVPAAFTHTTGLAHWELLLRARAVENQAYVIAPAQGGQHENGRRTFGHTMIVDPWGQVLGVLAEGEGVVIAELDAARLASVRRQLPALEHRRL